MQDVWFGVDVGGTNVKTALIDGQGMILSRAQFATKPSDGPAKLCQKIAESFVQSTTGIKHPVRVAGVGVGMPAFLDEAGKVVEAINLDYADVDFRKMLERLVQVPVVIDNDANMAALGESWQGAGRDASQMLCVTIGTGVGGGIVLQGDLYEGTNRMAGEIGHLIVQPDGGLPCNCGQSGCLETLASGTAILASALNMKTAGLFSDTVDIGTVADVFHLAKMGNVIAAQIVNRALNWLGYGLALAATILNPDVIVIGGGVGQGIESDIHLIQASFRKHTLARTAAVARIVAAQLGNDAGVVGAARRAMQVLG